MSDGKYGAVSGLIGRMQMMENISEHLSSAEVRGYKKGTPQFAAMLAEANSGMATKAVNYVKVSKEVVDFSPGQMEYTGDPLNLALGSDGFFQVQREDGSFGYTRKGLFLINADGILTDTNDQPVTNTGGGPITLPSSDVEIDPNGEVWFEGTQIDQIGVFQFDDNGLLVRGQGSMFAPPDGVQPTLNNDPLISQRNLERANIDILRTMAKMTGNLRAFEATQKALRVYSDMDSKASELGLVQ